jgi:NADP-dependent 3-hydroxy acid dehydrogenase YdfG
MTKKDFRSTTIRGRQPEAVVLLTHADCDAGYCCARELLANGHRLVVTAHHASRLTRILLGQDPDRVMAITADLSDPVQRSKLLELAGSRFGRVQRIVNGRTGSVHALKAGDRDFCVPPLHYPPLPKAS